MSHLDEDKKQLKKAIIEMIELNIVQLQKAEHAYLNADVEIAQEIIYNERRVNALELSIDRDCENFLVLFSPVASDMRLVVAALKINSDLERIGDYADSIADYVVEYPKKNPQEIINAVRVKKMFDVALSMLDDIRIAFEEGNNCLARKVYQKDTILNTINEEAPDIIIGYIQKDISLTKALLYLLSIIRKLERVGDHIKNIVENLIFYTEAKVIKHKLK